MVLIVYLDFMDCFWHCKSCNDKMVFGLRKLPSLREFDLSNLWQSILANRESSANLKCSLLIYFCNIDFICLLDSCDLDCFVVALPRLAMTNGWRFGVDCFGEFTIRLAMTADLCKICATTTAYQKGRHHRYESPCPFVVRFRHRALCC